MTQEYLTEFANHVKKLRTQASAMKQGAARQSNPRLRQNLEQSAEGTTFAAVALENTVIEVARKFDPRFDDKAFRRACDPLAKP